MELFLELEGVTLMVVCFLFFLDLSFGVQVTAATAGCVRAGGALG